MFVTDKAPEELLGSKIFLQLQSSRENKLLRVAIRLLFCREFRSKTSETKCKASIQCDSTEERRFVLANLGVFSTGFTLGWSSPSVVLLEAPDSRFPVTERQGAWLASLAPLGTAIGPFLSGWLLDFVGRRRTLMVYQLILLAGWGLMCVWSIWLMYVGRLLTGIALGGAMAATPVYVAEIATNSDRASVSSAFSLFMRIPLLVTFSIGPHISYHALILMSCVPIIGFLLLYPKMPESPHYSLLKKEEEESIKTLMWLRQMPEAAVLEEVKAIKALAKEERGQWKDLLTRKGNLKAVLILFSLHTFYQLSGGSVVIMCAQTIFNKTGISIRSDLCAVLIAAVMLTGTVVSPPIVSIWGYKKPLFGSVFGSAVSMGCFAYFNQQCENGIGTEFIQWAVVISLAAYIITNAAGKKSTHIGKPVRGHESLKRQVDPHCR
ncbi:hypothetical protein J6590_067232 [Homalodisca vitripennis]|nr:hypothetical protein J6590_067232 [Homalodisca vitripennis]